MYYHFELLGLSRNNVNMVTFVQAIFIPNNDDFKHSYLRMYVYTVRICIRMSKKHVHPVYHVVMCDIRKRISMI